MIDVIPQALAAIGSGGLVGFTLGLIGGGGSILSTPLLLYVVGTFGLATALNYAVTGLIDWPIAAEFIGGGVIGGLGGMALATRLAACGLRQNATRSTGSFPC